MREPKMIIRQKVNRTLYTKNEEQTCSKRQNKEEVYETIKKKREFGYMSKKEYKILPLIVIAILTLLCILYSISNLLIFLEIKEKATTEYVVSFKMMSDVIDIMAIAVSVWIGLNIYNVYSSLYPGLQ